MGSHDSATPLSVITKRNGDTICLEVNGDIDMTTADTFRAAMVTALGEPVDHVIVDLEGVRFMDSSGIAALVHAHDRSASFGSTLRVINCRPNVREVMEITHVYELLIRRSPTEPPH
jgi:anti-sigma B factor antagonist